MKKFLLLVAIVTSMLLSAFTAKAQTSVVATLSHDGQITCFYGVNALTQAHKASVNGDVITLSSGQFNACSISKAVTIRGAGAFLPEVGIAPTIIQGDFIITSPENTSDTPICFEGIYNKDVIKYKGNTYAQFVKCRLNNINYYDIYATYSKIQIINSYVVTSVYLNNNCNATCVNSYIYYPHSYSGSTSNFNFENCVVKLGGSNLFSSNFQNCIIIPSSTSSILNSTNTAFNCIAVGTTAGEKFFSNINAIKSNTVVANYEMFKSYKGSYSDDERFELTTEAAKTYLGSDDTQVGIYGGIMPFNPYPSNLRISTFKIDKTTKPNGKLGVEIKLNETK